MIIHRMKTGGPVMISGLSNDAESIYDMSGGANFILDEDHRLVAANAVFFDITGLDYAVIEEGLNFLSLVPDDEVLLFINFFKKRLDDPYNSPKTSEFRVIDSEKNEHKIILTAARIPETRKIFISSLELGRYLHQVDTREISTEGGQGSIEKTDTESIDGSQVDQYFHFSYLVEHQPEPVFVLIGSVIAYINEAGIRFFGKENRYDIIGRSPLDFVEKESKDKVIKTVEMMRNETVRYPLEERIKVKGREEVDVEISSVPVIYEGIAGFQYSIRDISLRKKSQEQDALRLRQLEVVNSILKSTASGFSLPEILESILEEIVDNCEFQSGSIYLKNDDPSTARLASAVNVPIWFKERYGTINIREWPYNIIFYAGQPRYVENLPDKPPGIFDVRILEDLAAISYAGIPIFSENTVVGVLYVTKDENPCFSPLEKATLEEIGKEVGSIVVKGIIEEKFETEYNAIKDFLGIALKENDRIWNTIISQKRVAGEYGFEEFNIRMELIKEISPRMDIINNLRVIYDIFLEGSGSLTPVCLDSVIRSAIYHFASAEIEYDRALYFVFADDNLSYVFINILSMFSAVQEKFFISIRHLNEKGSISIIIRDEGDSGIIDHIEGMLNIHAEEALRPSNIPMYVTKMLISAYNGTIEIINPDNGGDKSIVIRLKRCGRG